MNTNPFNDFVITAPWLKDSKREVKISQKDNKRAEARKRIEEIEDEKRLRGMYEL
ncbi:MAG: hypothetical protein GY782_03665 [Gammaproteobacteria bacterium]|nr:hypothetical protein [Gammaproteobacteria bacterium]